MKSKLLELIGSQSFSTQVLINTFDVVHLVPYLDKAVTETISTVVHNYFKTAIAPFFCDFGVLTEGEQHYKFAKTRNLIYFKSVNSVSASCGKE